MDRKDIATPSRTKELLNQFDFNSRESLGQNFLADANIIHKVIDANHIDKSTDVIEVGPGTGSLTEQLARNTKKVLSSEIDQRLIPVLKETLHPCDNVTTISEGILKADVATVVDMYLNDYGKITVIANLPYYITIPILLNLTQQDIPINDYVVMMQKEVGERLNAEVGTKAYDSLSTVTQCYTETGKVFTVPKSVFMPPPNVDSIVVKLIQGEKPLVSVDDKQTFFKLAKTAFAQRRETVNNNYQNSLKDDKKYKSKIHQWLENANIDPKRHGEALSVQDFARLYEEEKNFSELEN